VSYWQFVRRRQAIAILVLVTALSAGLRIAAGRMEHKVPSDTRCFLEVVAMVRGELGQREVTPQRITSPLYPLCILGAMAFTRDWLVAARAVSLVASSVTPALFCLLAWALERRLSVGLFAGLMAATASQLAAQGATPLAGALFVFLLALALLVALALVRRPSGGLALAAGILAGLLWATWGVGAFWLVAIGASLWVRLRASGSAAGTGQAAVPRTRGWAMLAAFGLAFVVCGQAPTVALLPYARGLKPPLPYLKACLVEGGLYAESTSKRDAVVYALNEDCTDFAYYDTVRRSSLGRLLREHWKDQVRAFLRNMDYSYRELLPDTTAPFFLLFFPLAFGLVGLWRTLPRAEKTLLVLSALPFLVLVQGIQLQPRYAYPLSVVTLPVVAVGLGQMRSAAGPGRRLGRFAALVILAFAVVSGEEETRHHFEDEQREAMAYREAAEWVAEQLGPGFEGFVMSRYQGAYAFFRRNHIHLPGDEPERVARFCKHTNTRYILLGRLEMELNLEFSRLFREHTRVVVEDMHFAVVYTAQPGLGRRGMCQVIEVRPARRSPARGPSE
jgi:hypothetical protein